MTTIAHNQFPGVVSAIDKGGEHALVTVKADLITLQALITDHELEKLDLKVGDAVTAGIRTTDVMFAVEKHHAPISVDNQFEGELVGVERGDVTTRATFKFATDDGKELVAVMTNPSADRTEIVKRGHVVACVKATDITLAIPAA